MFIELYDLLYSEFMILRRITFIELNNKTYHLKNNQSRSFTLFSALMLILDSRCLRFPGHVVISFSDIGKVILRSSGDEQCQSTTGSMKIEKS